MVKRMIKNVIFLPLAAYLGAMIAMHQFNTGHAMMIIPSKDGAFLAHDGDAERRENDFKTKMQREANLFRQDSGSHISKQQIAKGN